MNIEFILSKLPFLLQGSIMTIQLTVVTLIIGTFLGIILALLKISKIKIINLLATFYTWVFRGTPLILQLFFFYYALPILGITFSPFTAAVVGLSLNCGAYMAEIIRGGILAIDKGQFEASKALGYTYFQTMTKIVLPQTIRIILPPVGNEFIAMLKDTSLVSTIAMVELMRTATQISSATFKYTEMLFSAAVLYLVMTTLFTSAFSALEKKLAVYV
ncbi:inner membrane amino-acid ABC transporter permease protein YecS [Oxobacter pfennigii]|uniref:Inner membrane amino-acid ABC transporter permease protein YecS n=1 Tax=Oxobacter pfennigii TaxID=36849 RepID=A0A0P8WD31_9CLOT|nr:amino acid ABC transporter permease [Oxobacter pfennigii]KPU45677.1 inner membrane amino-acid ABC transporter permease protein YecS [Oxobacter pfennigii]